MIRLYTDQINAMAVQQLAQVYPTLGIRVMLGQMPFVTMKAKKNMRNTEFLLEMLQKYLKILQK